MATGTKGKQRQRVRYSEEFKDEALALAQKVGVMAAARDLGLYSSQIYGWRGQRRRRSQDREVEQRQAAEIARLKRQLADQDEELSILKKAAAYFAKHQR